MQGSDCSAVHHRHISIHISSIDRIKEIAESRKMMWEPTERENHVAERGLVPVNGGDEVQVQHEHGEAKMDGFVRRDQSCRYASSDIPSDLLVKVGGVNFHLHKHPMVSRSARLARLVDEASALLSPDAVFVTVVDLPDLPGGHGAFELVAKFCYGIMVDIMATNVAVLRCAAEYLEMTEDLEEGNLAFRAEAFLGYVVASSWLDSVVVLRCCEGLSPWAEDLQLVRRCSESVAAKACTNTRAVRWAYAGRMSPKTPRAGTSSDSRQQLLPPADWWVDDICVLRIDHFVRVVTAIQAKGMRCDLIGAAITRYSSKWLSAGINKESSTSHDSAPWTQAGVLQMVIAGEGDLQMEMANEQRMVVESLISIIPPQKDCVSCGFLLRLLRLAVMLKAAPALVTEVEKHVGMQLEQAALPDLLVPSYPYGRADAAYDVDLVQRLVEQFVVQEQSPTAALCSEGRGKEKQEQQQNAKALRVARLLDSYLSEVSRDRNLALSKFQALAESLPESARVCHDGLYRAIDSYLKAHPAATEHERKRLCRALDCGKLSREVRMHAAQNERLPLRVVVHVLLSEQAKMTSALAKVGKKEEDVNALRQQVDSVNAKYNELQREVELLQKQVERMPPPSAAGKQQSVSGWTSGWKKLGRLGRIPGASGNEGQSVVTAAPDKEVSQGPRRRRNSAS
ncbi:coleoptile phototropism protein 1-like isoform X1 [Phragmites australis]|uniref:coleoptile phototropism protein 1-like isoform X1 n=1 Tax=Phragmites australis TaxID=29695 RepID=UPI002D78F002|nr:coleoptile phototropism protein 1-like isoform X1 [Phragmites australis]